MSPIENPQDQARARLPPATVEAIGEMMEALASPTRIAMLEALRGGEASVQQLADDLDVSHRNASHHAAILRRSGILSRRREGALAIYSISDWTAPWLIEQAAGAFADPDA
jgi:ArsR family transcriptional regulator, nickel/cobalt-responsive transcriptional repressor